MIKILFSVLVFFAIDLKILAKDNKPQGF